MANIVKDNLFILIKSLSRSEKRQFKLYVNRLGDNIDAKFLKLFSLLEKLDEYDENIILKSKIVSKVQLSNLKAHLYKQILISLRMNPVNQNIRIQIREQLDFATILYHKGLYKQSLKILDKAKQTAIEQEEKNIAYEIVELEKIIESQYITRSTFDRADVLAAESKTLSRQNVIASKLSNLSLQLYNYMLKSGYAKNIDEIEKIEHFFLKKMPKINIKELSFRELLWYYKANLWYHFLIQDFLSCYKYATKWVDLFYANPKMICQNPVWYIKGCNYLMECLYMIKHHTKLQKTLAIFHAHYHAPLFPKNDNLSSLYFLSDTCTQFNLFFMTGNFQGGLYLVNETLQKIEQNKDRIDEHHIMVLYYKIACLYFGAAQYQNCIQYLDKIIENKNLIMREDLLCFARVLSLVAHYDAGIDAHLESQLKNTYKFLIKMNDMHQVQKEMILFLKNLDGIYPSQMKTAFCQLHEKLKSFENHPFEKRAFLYLDIISWLESKIQNKPVAEIIKQKNKNLLK